MTKAKTEGFLDHKWKLEGKKVSLQHPSVQ